MTILYWVVGIIFALTILYFWVAYKMMVWSAVILRSAGKMKTGNDLGEQLDDTLEKEKDQIPGFFKFYWMMLRPRRNK